jgi:hypothetical protein
LNESWHRVISIKVAFFQKLVWGVAVAVVTLTNLGGAVQVNGSIKNVYIEVNNNIIPIKVNVE